MSKVIQLEYRSLGNQYPSLYLCLPEKKYLEEKEKYQELTTELVWKMLTARVLEELPESLQKKDDWELAQKVWTELVNSGMEETMVRELDEEEQADLDPEEEAQAKASAILAILNQGRTPHEG